MKRTVSFRPGRWQEVSRRLAFEPLEDRQLLTASYAVTNLGTLPGIPSSSATGINVSGQVVGSAVPPATGLSHAFLYSGGVMQDLGTLRGGYSSSASGINDNGQIVGDSSVSNANGGFTHAVLYSGGIMQDLGTLPGGSASSASGINDNEQVVGNSNTAAIATHAFLYSNGAMQDLGTLPGGNFSSASGINDIGQVVGESNVANYLGTHAFLYSGGIMQDLGTLPGGSASSASGINDIGQVVGESNVANYLGTHAFLYSGGIMQDLGTLSGGNVSSARGINDNGQVVGDSYVPFPHNVDHAFLYSGGVMKDLNSLIDPSSGWVLNQATGINAAGQIIGDGTYNGQSLAFLLTPVNDMIPQLSLSEATTLDAKSVAVTYGIANAAVTNPLTFNVYRSATPTFDSSSTLIGTQTIDPAMDPTDLQLGNHTVTLISGTNLPPDPSHPYVVVVADANNSVPEAAGSVNTAYFRKFLVGVISHGFNFSTSTVTPDWEQSMATDLMIYDNYDFVIPFNWMAQSHDPEPGLAAAAGHDMYSQVVKKANELAAVHAGDVVDLHFIGHSRGAVVVSQAMLDLVGTTDSALEGSYIKATFLDPHPANGSTIGLASGYPIPVAALLGGELLWYDAVSTLANDRQVVVPTNVKDADVYYQHSSYLDGFILKPFVAQSASEFFLNLWGEGPNDGIIEDSASPIEWHNLTDNVDTSDGPDGLAIGPIGHSEVPTWYLMHVVDAGLASSVAGTGGNVGAPTLDPIANPLTLPTNSGEQHINLTGIGSGSGGGSTVSVVAASDNPGLIPNPIVDYASPNSTGVLAFTPAAGASGSAIITVTVNNGSSNGDNTIVRTFVVTVGAADLIAPTSDVTPLPQRARSLTFLVTIKASDGSSVDTSGVAFTEVDVSTDGGPWTPWTVLPAGETSAEFTGQSGNTYAFHSIAYDNAGNAQFVPSDQIQASTYVPDLTAPTTQVTSATNTTSGAFTLNFSGTAAGGSGLKTIAVFVQVDNGAVQTIGQYAGGLPVAGVYTGQATYQGLADGNSHTYRFFSEGTNGNGIQEAAHVAPNDAQVTATFQVPLVPQATAFSVEHGLAERSYVRYLDVTFNEPISQLTLDTSHVVLEQFGLDGTTFVQNVDLTGKIKLIDHVMELDFGAAGLGGNANSTAADGYYKLLINPDGLGTHSLERDFFRLLGNVTGSGTVSNADLAVIAAALGQSGSMLNADVNGDGYVNAYDRTLALHSIGRHLAAGLHLD